MKSIFINHHGLFTLFMASGLMISIMSGCSSRTLLQPSQKPNQVVLSNFQVTLKHFDTDQFNTGDYASLIVALREQAFPSADLIQVHRRFNPKQNKLIKQQLDSVYTVLQRDFKDIGMNLLPSNYLAGKRDIPVGPYGFPHSSDIKTNAKEADAALDITLYLEAQGIDVNNIAPYTNDVRYRPRLTVDLKLVSNSGNVIWKDQEIAVSKQLVQIEERTSGVKTLEVQSEPDLSDMVNSAIQEMIARLPASLRKDS